MNKAPSTIAAHAGGPADRFTGGVISPIHLATTFERAGDNSVPHGNVYARADNPSFRQVESTLAKLENAADALVFASGMAAATAVFMALSPGDHVVAPKQMYWALRSWLQTEATRWGLNVDLVDMTDLNEVKRVVQLDRTKLIWIETPANPTWDITDIAGVVEIAHAAGARVAVDSTVSTPILTQPLALGADIVMHSGTKFLNGHSDVVAGVLATKVKDEMWERIVSHRARGGAILGPFESFLLARGLRTLAVRMPVHCGSARTLAERLAGHPAISRVLYPGLDTHPGHAIAARQMKPGFGGMLSIRIANGRDSALRVLSRVELFTRATSLGGTESLIEHRASAEGPGTLCPTDLLRISVGLEDVEDLWDDLKAALVG
jgi:cystathionine gamma-synthase